MLVATLETPKPSPKVSATFSSLPPNPPVANITDWAFIVNLPPSAFSAMIPLTTPSSIISSVALVEYNTVPPFSSIDLWSLVNATVPPSA